MKQILIVYGLIGLFLLAILSILSYGSGAGYVYVLWHGLQIQTNIWFVLFFFLIVSFILNTLWLFLKRSMVKQKRKIEQINEFSSFHTYEQLGIVWILEGEGQQKEYIQPVFQESGLLKNIIESRLYFKQGDYEKALNILKDTPSSAFELAEIQKIEIFIAYHDPENALTHLEFLSGHQLSPWLQQVQEIYYKRITKLWGEFATQYPWMYLKAVQHGHLDQVSKAKWLSELLVQFDQATLEDMTLLQQRYLERQEYLKTAQFDVKTLWLKLLSRMPEMAQQQENLALLLLDERFDEEVFYLWFQQQLLKQHPDYQEIEKEIDLLEVKYPSIPIFTFSRWHIYKATHRDVEANSLLKLYPDNILMNYLRIKSTLNGDEDLIQQLNSVFEQDTKFVQFKI